MDKLYNILLTIACVTIIIIFAMILYTSVQDSWQHVEKIAATIGKR